ncbi:MAG: hypothetical protein KJ886_06105, partial [Candidatus Thermoplasmatota archaeon]|nr:hypothetical protein [Candidatus Thermoplasmatota archaeon]
SASTMGSRQGCIRRWDELKPDRSVIIERSFECSLKMNMAPEISGFFSRRVFHHLYKPHRMVFFLYSFSAPNCGRFLSK